MTVGTIQRQGNVNQGSFGAQFGGNTKSINKGEIIEGQYSQSEMSKSQFGVNTGSKQGQSSNSYNYLHLRHQHSNKMNKKE